MTSDQITTDWSLALRQANSDPLHVLRFTWAVMTSADDVAIDMTAVNRLADQLATSHTEPAWDAELHDQGTGRGDDESTAMWILLLDALNFCFWGQGTGPSVRWRVERRGELVDGYVALVAALERGLEEDVPLDDPDWLATMSREEVEDLLRPAPRHPEIPLLAARDHHIWEIGHGLNTLESDTPASDLIRGAKGSAITLVREIVRLFPSFNDVATWDRSETGLPGHEIRFYKRAQILVGDLAGGLKGSPLGVFHDLDQLTAFADYKVPQVLRQLGILRYSDALASWVAARRHLPAGSSQEVEIRAATIWGCELLRQALADRGRDVAAHELDWLLWEQGQSLPEGTEPYHLTPTVFY